MSQKTDVLVSHVPSSRLGDTPLEELKQMAQVQANIDYLNRCLSTLSATIQNFSSQELAEFRNKKVDDYDVSSDQDNFRGQSTQPRRAPVPQKIGQFRYKLARDKCQSKSSAHQLHCHSVLLTVQKFEQMEEVVEEVVRAGDICSLVYM